MERHDKVQEPLDSAASASKNENEQQQQTPPKDDTCRFCKRPSCCPNCSTELSPPPKSGANDLDGDVPDIYNQLPPPIHDLKKDSHPEFLHCKPPKGPEYRKFSVFAAGSIEMGKAIQWQPLLENYLCTLPITLCNPRRGQWDPNITPSALSAAFGDQVRWELNALSRCTVICFFFDYATMSPVSMMELGLQAESGKVVVCCDRRFWKGGNIHLVCQRHNIPWVETFEELVPLVKAMLRTKGMIVDRKGRLTEVEEERDPEVSMTLKEAEEYCRVRTGERQGLAPA